jgi:hypothetical protein
MASDGNTVVHDLAEAAWAEADVALANAWRDMTRLANVLDAAAEARAGDAVLEELSGEALLVRQSLDRAVRLRGLAPIGAEGESVFYDPALHEVVDGPAPSRKGVKVRIVAAGLGRRVAASVEPLAPALVARLKRAAATKSPKAPTRRRTAAVKVGARKSGTRKPKAAREAGL